MSGWQPWKMNSHSTQSRCDWLGKTSASLYKSSICILVKNSSLLFHGYRLSSGRLFFYCAVLLSHKEVSQGYSGLEQHFSMFVPWCTTLRALPVGNTTESVDNVILNYFQTGGQTQHSKYQKEGFSMHARNWATAITAQHWSLGVMRVLKHTISSTISGMSTTC